MTAAALTFTFTIRRADAARAARIAFVTLLTVAAIVVLGIAQTTAVMDASAPTGAGIHAPAPGPIPQPAAELEPR